jgi:hypothetical protein
MKYSITLGTAILATTLCAVSAIAGPINKYFGINTGYNSSEVGERHYSLDLEAYKELTNGLEVGITSEFLAEGILKRSCRSFGVGARERIGPVSLRQSLRRGKVTQGGPNGRATLLDIGLGLGLSDNAEVRFDITHAFGEDHLFQWGHPRKRASAGLAFRF